MTSTSTTVAGAITAAHPITDAPTTCWRVLPADTWADEFTMVVVTFARGLTDEESETAAALFGYAWAKHGAPKHTGSTGDHFVMWDMPHRMIVHARMDLRVERSRTRGEACRDLVTDYTRMLTEGSPTRRDGTALIPPVGGLDVCPVRFYVDQARP